MAITTNSALIGIVLIIIGMIVKFELKVINTEEQQEMGEGNTKNQ